MTHKQPLARFGPPAAMGLSGAARNACRVIVGKMWAIAPGKAPSAAALTGSSAGGRRCCFPPCAIEAQSGFLVHRHVIGICHRVPHSPCGGTSSPPMPISANRAGAGRRSALSTSR
jgi:hypothetical protein